MIKSIVQNCVQHTRAYLPEKCSDNFVEAGPKNFGRRPSEGFRVRNLMDGKTRRPAPPLARFRAVVPGATTEAPRSAPRSQAQRVQDIF